MQTICMCIKDRNHKYYQITISQVTNPVPGTTATVKLRSDGEERNESRDGKKEEIKARKRQLKRKEEERRSGGESRKKEDR